ncbi:MAG: YggS family pyridoxal phosphate-dependent enzyme [Campylobacteraceae bacterium]|jgi:pyridoxal phosphate enzyme (YggS family)|nr:YggS family pyridoxal phosphate-dependent enzyme [Campylobacteraceae bacterium]
MDYCSKLRDISLRIENAKQNSRFKEDIKLVAVSKTVTSTEVAELYKAGCTAFGENRVQALKDKCEELYILPIEWHFIGRLQTNKINQLIALHPILIHSCDSLKLALEIDKRLKAVNQTLDALLQINSAKEPTKAGVKPENAMEVYKEIIHTCQHLKLKGVMSIGAHTNNISAIHKSFETTREIYELALPFGAKYCSMGMSADFELAIKCGANIIRLGSILFK